MGSGTQNRLPPEIDDGGIGMPMTSASASGRLEDPHYALTIHRPCGYYCRLHAHLVDGRDDAHNIIMGDTVE
jgi:hypothetical protein